MGLQRKDRGIAVVIVLFMLLQPFLVSAVVGAVTDITQQTVIPYNMYNQTTGSSKTSIWRIVNSTSGYNAAQTDIIDNDTYTDTVASLTHANYADIGTMTDSYFTFSLNTTFLADYTVSRIVIGWNYVGSGNITGFQIQKTTPAPATNLYNDLALAWAENGTFTFSPETFQAIQLKSSTLMYFRFHFDDTSNMPSTGDFFECSILFYESTLIVTSEFLCFAFGAVLGFVDLLILLAITSIWNPLKKKG